MACFHQRATLASVTVAARLHSKAKDADLHVVTAVPGLLEVALDLDAEGLPQDGGNLALAVVAFASRVHADLRLAQRMACDLIQRTISIVGCSGSRPAPGVGRVGAELLGELVDRPSLARTP